LPGLSKQRRLISGQELPRPARRSVGRMKKPSVYIKSSLVIQSIKTQYLKVTLSTALKPN
jgi:hypothetical protein